ncbi:hypothetical protein [Sphingomonas sp. RS2018]
MFIAALLLQTAAAPACPATPAALQPALAGWLQKGDDLATMKAVTVPSMDPATVRLADIPYPEAKGRMALTGVTIKTAATYGVALDQKGWLDVYRAGDRTPLVSVAHGHGPDCSGIRKIVRFALTPGSYRVVASGLDRPQAVMMLVRE